MKSSRINSQALAAIAIGALLTTSAFAQQASVTLQNNDAQYCYTHNNEWTLSKEVSSSTVQNGQGTATWTVTAVKSDGGTTFTVHGGLTILNSGTAPAPIGNIVFNLQKPNSPKKGGNASYVSIAADIADATHGDAATAASIVAAGSQEDAKVNAAWGVNNYTVLNATGTFTETVGSGKLEFKDASNNTIFSLKPQMVIPVGEAVTLLYDAQFQTSVLPPAGTQLRVEALVSFGGVGPRGGGGAAAAQIDVDGSGFIEADEAYVRTVPARTTMASLPAAPTECNVSVTVTDSGVTTAGTVTISNPTGFDQFPATVSQSTSWTVSVDVDSGTDGGQVCNTAELNSAACSGTLNVVIGPDLEKPIYDANGNIIGYQPLYATYECAPAAHEEAESCVDVAPPGAPVPTPPFQSGDFCTYTQGKYNDTARNPVAVYVANNFSALFPQGLLIGIAEGTGHYAEWTDVTKFRQWIGGGGPSGALTANTVNATSTSGGGLASQTATLTMTLALSGSSDGQPAGLGNLKLYGTGTSLDGLTISEILAVANNALGAGVLPNDYTFSTLNALIDNLNNSFDDCTPKDWAQKHLSR